MNTLLNYGATLMAAVMVARIGCKNGRQNWLFYEQ